MKILVGCVLAGTGKNYAVPKWLEMAEHVFTDVDIAFAVDYKGRVPYTEIEVPEMRDAYFATWVVYWGKEALRKHALEHGYTHLVWQGIDCYYETKAEFEELAANAKRGSIVGAVVAGRNREDYPVCREFVYDWDEREWTTEQRELNESLFTQPAGVLLMVSGYIGSDATFVSRHALTNVSMDGYEHWHERGCQGLGPEEWFMYSAIANNMIVPVVNTNIRPWHAHEDGRTVKYKGHVCSLDELSWEKNVEKS